MNQRLLSGVAAAGAALGPGAGEAFAQPQALQTATPHAATYRPQIEGTDYNGIGINEPLSLEVLEVALGGVILGRIVRGLRVRGAYKRLDGKAESTAIGMRRVQELSTRQADDLAEDEPQVGKLHGIKDDLDEGAERLEAARGTFRQHYVKARNSFWPSKDWVKVPGSIIDSETIRAQAAADEGRGKQLRLAVKADKIHSSVQTFSTEAGNVSGRAQDMRESGWDLDHLEAQVEETGDLARQARRLESTGNVSQAKELIEGHSEDITTVYEAVDSLPARREQADASIDTIDQRLETSARLVADARARLASMAATYDISCYADLQKRDEGLDEAMHNLEQNGRQARNHRGELSVKSLETSEDLLAEFDRVQQDIADAAEKVQERAVKLVEIEANLPSTITDIEAGLTKTHDYSFEKHAGDVEDDTRQAVTDLQRKLAKLKAKASADKPAYLELDETATEYQEAAEQIHQQAKQQRQEMEDLRQGAKRGAEYVREITRSIGRMLSSENDYRGGAWTEIDWKLVRRLRDSIEWPEVNTELSRVELRKQRGSITADERHVDSVYREIQGHVRRARETKHIKERTRRELGPLW